MRPLREKEVATFSRRSGHTEVNNTNGSVCIACVTFQRKKGLPCFLHFAHCRLYLHHEEQFSGSVGALVRVCGSAQIHFSYGLQP